MRNKRLNVIAAFGLAMVLSNCVAPPPEPLIAFKTADMALNCETCAGVVSIVVENAVQEGNFFQARLGAIDLEQELRSLFPSLDKLGQQPREFRLSMAVLEMSSSSIGFGIDASGRFKFTLEHVNGFLPTWSREVACKGHTSFGEYPKDSVVRNRVAVFRCLNDGLQQLFAALRVVEFENNRGGADMSAAP